MKSIVIEQVENGYLVSQNAHRFHGDWGLPQKVNLFVYCDIADLQKDLPRLLESADESATSCVTRSSAL